MITWTLKNEAGISRERIEEVKQAFLKKIGPYRQEFEEKNGYVEIDFGVSEEQGAAYSFSYDGDIFDFNHRVNAYNCNTP